MHKKLLTEVFKRIKENEKESTGIEPSTSAAAKLISEYISETKKIPFGPKSLTDYHREAENEKGEKRDVTIKQPKVVEAMCNILGHDNFTEFKKYYNTNVPLKSTQFIKQFFKQRKNVLIISVITIIMFSIFFYINQERWMIWHEDHYIEVKLDVKKYDINQLKAYKEERILNFKKIKPDCYTEFFNEDGSENLWYGKNKDGELEYFTDLGWHPETGSTLKKITKHMIKKHICETF